MNLNEIKGAATENKTNDDNVFDNNYEVDDPNVGKLRDKASIVAKTYLTNWFENRKDGINNILNCFDGNGNIDENNKFDVKLTATAFNDLYKWTMMPVIRAMEKSKANGKVHVTFGIDLRSPNAKEKMKNEDFRAALLTNLQAMANREFDITAFKNCLTVLRDGIIDENTIKSICGDGQNPRTLAQEVKDAKNDYNTDDDKVRIYLYDTGDNGWVVEATGPWHKVTWLETSMMQCVYQTMLMHDLQIKKKSYSTWLGEALLRCAKSVAFTHLMNANAKGKASTPALFTGRRTGGLLFILLQNLFFADHFKQFGLDSNANGI